ncbi:MAG: carbon-phosphorus lyase complex subunit PhnI [Deltaproteobacteria bacterium]|jgi:alpha-D-ribose 1-methylphosphonate 5-triphosphate synthase subunit PhnI|nr:carbon-phosphorus lyase complex subunit PhnI [Deltaproteobacteria bacterium]
MYVAVKGGQKAISEAHKLLEVTRRGDTELAEISLAQLQNQLSLAVDRVQAEGSLYAPRMAALAVKQAQGDLVEAIFLLRAARASLKRFGYSEPIKTTAMRPRRRISGTFKDIPGGQILGPTFDYTHRLLKPSLMDGEDGVRKVGQDREPGQDSQKGLGGLGDPLEAWEDFGAQAPEGPKPSNGGELTGVASILELEGLIETIEDLESAQRPFDLTREPLEVPLNRGGRLQALARADEGFLLALAYSSQRGFGSVHPFVAELRLGPVELEFRAPELDLVITVGEIEVTECQTANQFKGGGGKPPMFTRGYGLTFGHNERKALSMAIVDRALRSRELNEAIKGPAQNEEFVLYHSDNVEASGFVSHIKLPHYVDFQAELSMLREMRKKLMAQKEGPGPDGETSGPESKKE